MYCCVLRPSLEQLDKLIFCECKTNEKEAYAMAVKILVVSSLTFPSLTTAHKRLGIGHIIDFIC